MEQTLPSAPNADNGICIYFVPTMRAIGQNDYPLSALCNILLHKECNTMLQ